MELNSYMEHGIKSISSTVSAFYLNNLKGIKFISGFVPSLARASRLRKESREKRSAYSAVYYCKHFLKM